MTTVSYPLSGANFTSAQWRAIFTGHTGIVDADGTAAKCGDLSLSAVSDVATIAAGLKVWYRGYVLEVTVSHGMTLAAAVGSAKTYSVGVMFDPANETTNPLTLYSALKTSITIPSGGSFHTLFEVTRQVSQTLNLAAKADLRTYVGPHMTGPLDAQPSDATIGTRFHDGVDDWLRVRTAALTGSEWQCLTRPITTALTLGGLYVGDVNLEHFDGRAALVGGASSIAKAAATPFVVGTTYSSLFTIPTTSRPADALSWIVSASTGSGPASGRLAVAPDGVVTFSPITQCVTFRVEGPSWTRAS